MSDDFGKTVDNWLTMPGAFAPALPPDEEDSATARGIMLGDNTADPAATGTSIYTNFQNLPTAVASILNHSQNRANFHPASMEPEELLRYFAAYTTEIDKTPFFSLAEDDVNKQKFASKDFNVLIDQVVSLYDGVSSNDQSKLKNAIADMAKSVFSQQKSERWKNLFSQSTMDLSNLATPRIMIYYTSLYMKHETGIFKPEVNEQSYTVHRTSYFVLPDLISSNAKKLEQLDSKSVDDWLGAATSPEQDDAKLCFDVKAYASQKRDIEDKHSA